MLVPVIAVRENQNIRKNQKQASISISTTQRVNQTHTKCVLLFTKSANRITNMTSFVLFVLQDEVDQEIITRTFEEHHEN